MHAEELRKQRAAQADLQMQLDTQLRNVSDKDVAVQLLQGTVKELGSRVDELEKQLRDAGIKLLERADEVARLESQRDDLKSGNAAAREALRKASTDVAAMQAKIDSLNDEKIELDREKRDVLAKMDDRDFRLSEMEKQLNSAAVRGKESELEIARLAKEKMALSAGEQLTSLCIASLSTLPLKLALCLLRPTWVSTMTWVCLELGCLGVG